MRAFLLSVLVLSGLKLLAQGHYMGSSFNPNDYFAPPPGFIIPVYYSYASMNYYNAEGNKSDQLINPVPGNPTSLSIEQQVNTHSFIAMVLYGGKNKILGANWGVMLLPTLNSPTANITLDYYSTQTDTGRVTLPSSSLGLGDLYVQPLWLSWTKPKWTYGLSYGMWLPIGRYSAGDAKNTGLGYLSHNIRAATKYVASPQWSVSMTATMELNHKQSGVDFTEAPHLTIDLGGVHTFKKGHEFGMFGHYTKQLGEDTGTEGSFVSDRTFGIGAYGSYWLKPLKYGLLARYVQNFGVRNRFGGGAFAIGFNMLFLNLPATP